MKENKGITLIALVVTIIILLILAGVSITTLSGDGLFGRAESSAAKYEQASQAENSTLTSLMDKYDRYETETETTEAVTIKWTSAIAAKGSFINSLNPDQYRNSNFFDKQVVLTKPDGTKIILNPYEAVNIKAPKGSTLDFYYYRTKDADGTMFLGPNENGPMNYLNIIDTAKDGKLVISKCVVTSGMTFEFGYDAIDEDAGEHVPGWDGNTLYVWCIPISINEEEGGEPGEGLPPAASDLRIPENQLEGNAAVAWDNPIAKRGSFINSLTPSEYVNSNYYDKEVIAIKPDGTKQLLNPYQSVETEFPEGTVLRFYYYRDKTTDGTGVDMYEKGPLISKVDFDKDGKLCYMEYTLESNTAFGVFTDENTDDWDSDYMTGTEGKTISAWQLNVSAKEHKTLF